MLWLIVLLKLQTQLNDKVRRLAIHRCTLFIDHLPTPLEGTAASFKATSAILNSQC